MCFPTHLVIPPIILIYYENGSLWEMVIIRCTIGTRDGCLFLVKIVDGNLSRVSVIQVSSGYRHTVFSNWMVLYGQWD